jgi:delta14-sterol reductase/lamin-B receptor
MRVQSISNKNNKKKENNNKHDHHRFEFGGPIGATCLVTLLPVLILVLYYGCNKEYCASWDVSSIIQSLLYTIANPTVLLNSILDQEKLYYALIIYVGWMLFQLILERMLPGEVAEGVPLEDGTKLKYTISGHLQFWISILAMGHVIPKVFETTDGVYVINRFQSLDLSLTYEYYPQLIVVSSIGALLLSVYLYITSFIPGRILAKGGNTGYHIYDFWMGRELNPRIGSLDLKEFCELRPGLIGWFVLNLGMAAQQLLFFKGFMSGMLFFKKRQS